MTTSEKYEHVVRKKHIGEITLTLSIGILFPVGIICLYAWGEQVDAFMATLIVKIIGSLTFGLALLYFLFLVAVACWVQIIKRNQHDH